MYTFRIADSSQADLAVWQKLRTDVYLAEGYIRDQDLCTDELFRDTYDGHSIHVLAADRSGKPVGCVRMIEGRLGGLQVQHEFSLGDADNDALEVSGCVVIPEHRKSFVTLGLYRALFEVAIDLGYLRAYMIVEKKFLDALTDLGLPLSAVSDARLMYNTLNVAAVLTIRDIANSLDAADQRRHNATTFGKFFRERFDWTIRASDVLSNSTDIQPSRNGR